MIDFEEVYRDYLEDVYRFSLALCRDPVLAEELTQETFFRALEHIGQFRGECTLRVWLCQIAKHAWLTHCRRQRRREPEPELREEGPEERLAQKETAMEVHQVLHSLPEPYREVFALRVLGEKKKDGKDISSFQALMISTASRVGTGNIAGVASSHIQNTAP